MRIPIRLRVDLEAEGRSERWLSPREVRVGRWRLASEMLALLVQDLEPTAPKDYRQAVRQASEVLRKLGEVLAQGKSW